MSEIHFWTTSAAPGKELSYWKKATCEAIFEVDLEAVEGAGPLAASIQQQQLGAISLSRMEINFGQIVRRTSQSIARSRSAQLELVYLENGHLFLRQAGREAQLRAGECMLVDSREPYELTTAPESRNLSFHLPLKWLQQWLPQHEASIAVPITAQSPWGRVLLAAMCAIPTGPVGDFGSQYAEQIAGALALAVRRDEMSGSSVHARGLFTRVRKTLLNLAHDETVDARRVASEHRISVRYLHSIFAGAGTTYSRELMQIRLDRAARMIRDRRFAELSISEIAWRCAFYDASHLTRHFRKHFACTPGEYRSQH